MRELTQLAKRNLGKEVALVRIDLNIDPKEAKYSSRVFAIVPTVRFLRSRGAQVVLISHRGRPHGKPERKLSLKPFVSVLNREFGERVEFIGGNSWGGIKRKVKQSKAGIVLLENIRFFKGEEEGNKKIAGHLARLGSMYVNDAFAVSHRANASVYAIARLRPSYAGLLLASEVKNLSRVARAPRRPLVVVIGGAKVSTKIGLFRSFAKKASSFLVGGAMANTFLEARGEDIGDSLYEPEAIGLARRLLKSGKIILPVDTVQSEKRIMDIGPKTQKKFSDYIRKAGSVLWNGPLGYSEDKRFSRGTSAVLRAAAGARAFTVVGGGETVELIEHLGMAKKFGFVSTGGGAMLEFLSGKKLPGIEVLREKKHKVRIKNQGRRIVNQES